MTTLRRFAFAYGIVFTLVAVAGFIPGITQPHSHPDVRVTAFLGTVFGLFPVNILHDAAHLLFGLWGFAASRTDGAARAYARVVAIAYAVLGVMGMVTTMNLHTAFGFVPLYGHDVWLHFGLAAVAAYFAFMHPVEQERVRRA